MRNIFRYEKPFKKLSYIKCYKVFSMFNMLIDVNAVQNRRRTENMNQRWYRKWSVRIFWCRRVPENDSKLKKSRCRDVDYWSTSMCAYVWTLPAFLNSWFLSKLSSFFIRVLIFLKPRRGHYFLRNRLVADMHLWERHGASIQKR